MEKTAVEWLVQKYIESGVIFLDDINQAKEIEIQQSHEYAEFAIRCDRKEMKILNFDGFIKLNSNQ